MDIEHLREWIGRREETEDVASNGPLARLAAMLDHEHPPWRDGEVPPLGHWLCFLPSALERDLDSDGHPRRGGFLPPVTLRRRMWAGGLLEFRAPLRVGDRLRRVSTIAAVTHKKGRSGDLVFVKVEHAIMAGDTLAVREEQDLVYREVRGPAKPAPVGRDDGAMPPAEWQRDVRPDPAFLFRFSALTFNAHRIHYDRDYCRDVEEYPGLVVHAPLTATLLMDLFLRHHPGAAVGRFVYLAHHPLFDTAPFTINGASQGTRCLLWAMSDTGAVAMTAELEVA